MLCVCVSVAGTFINFCWFFFDYYFSYQPYHSFAHSLNLFAFSMGFMCMCARVWVYVYEFGCLLFHLSLLLLAMLYKLLLTYLHPILSFKCHTIIFLSFLLFFSLIWHFDILLTRWQNVSVFIVFFFSPSLSVLVFIVVVKYFLIRILKIPFFCG